MEKLTANTFEEKIASGVVLVDFFADWCGPCKMMAPVLEEIANEREDVHIYKVNVDEEGSLAQQFNVMSIPTLVLFKDGKAVATTMGFNPKPAVEAFIQKAL